MDALAGSLNNLALAATNNKTALQQLTAANLALTTTVATLTSANKKLTETVARFNLPRGGQAGRGAVNRPKAVWGNYCWTHGYKTSHTSATCGATWRLPGHNATATVADTKGGKVFNKDWYLQGNKDT